MTTPLNMQLTSLEYRNITQHFQASGSYQVINTGQSQLKIVCSDTQPSVDDDIGIPLTSANLSSNNVIEVSGSDGDVWAIVDRGSFNTYFTKDKEVFGSCIAQ